MRLLLDENIHAGLHPWLVQRGHDVARISSGAKNGQVIAQSVSEQRILLTHDKDFGDVLRYPPARHQGIVLVRIHPPRLPTLQSALEKLFAELSPEAITHRLIILEAAAHQVLS